MEMVGAEFAKGGRKVNRDVDGLAILGERPLGHQADGSTKKQ
jgi:hypothetical protein